MYPLPDKPVVVLYVGKKPDGSSDIRTANNIAPETQIILCDSVESFDEFAKGKSFHNP